MNLSLLQRVTSRIWNPVTTSIVIVSGQSIRVRSLPHSSPNAQRLSCFAGHIFFFFYAYMLYRYETTCFLFFPIFRVRELSGLAFQARMRMKCFLQKSLIVDTRRRHTRQLLTDAGSYSLTKDHWTSC